MHKRLRSTFLFFYPACLLALSLVSVIDAHDGGVVMNDGISAIFQTPCQKDGDNTGLSINNEVWISVCSGKVAIKHPERMDDASIAFWESVQKAWPDMCAPPSAKKVKKTSPPAISGQCPDAVCSKR